MPQYVLAYKIYYVFLLLEELKAKDVFHRARVRVNIKRTKVDYLIASVRLEAKSVRAALSCLVFSLTL